MSRPSDWSALDHWDDPVPGVPNDVEDGAAAMALVAQTIAEAAVNLREIASTEGQESDAVAAFRERANQTADEIELVQERYAQTGEALAGYVQPLRQAQQQSIDALEAAIEARQRLNTAETDVYNANLDVQYAVDDAARETANEALSDAYIRQGNAETDLGSARTLLNGAIDDRDAAADTAIGLIETALEVNGLNDSAWSQFLNKYADILDGIATALAIVGTILAVVALFVPGLNLLVIGIAVGVGAAAINFALAQNGNKGWGDFAMDVIGLATLGMGRIATSVLRGARASRATTVAANRAERLAPPFRRPGTRTAPGRRPNHGRGVNRHRRQRMNEGRANQQAEYAQYTNAPNVSLRNPSSMIDAARHNIATNGWRNVLMAGGGDAYQMTYYNAMRTQGMGGGQAAEWLYRASLVTGGGENASTVFGATGFLPFDNPVASWGGSLVDAIVPDAPRQDDVMAVR